ncbi:MAG TPA: hypothetical protein VHZ55_25400, partial [Bryobacteraceae bacterium]|nr:hypothetical protein [Bryobacteraceae bacterium]
DHLNLNTVTTRPMTNVFDLNQKEWNFKAAPSGILGETSLPLGVTDRAGLKSTHDSTYWAEVTKGFDFSGEDRVNADLFNRVLWQGLKGTRYPTKRTQTNFRDDDDH